MIRSLSFPVIFCAASLFTVVTGAAAQTADRVSGVSVQTLVAEISANNPELKFYEAEIGAAKARGRSATAWANPELGVELGRKRVRDVSGTLAGEGAAWSVSLTQTFDWPGRLALRKAIANRDVTLAELGLARFEHALASRTRLLAYGLYAANTKAAAVAEVAARFAALKETFLAREPAGITPLLETRVIESSELVLQHRASEAELAVQSALLELNQLRGAPAAAPLKVNVVKLKLSDAPSSEALLAAATENNFSFKLRRAELEQQGFAVRLARNERYPSISVSPFVSQEKAGDKETVVGIGLSIPLPVGGATGAGAATAAARERQAEAAVRMAARELEREVLVAAETLRIKLAEIRRWSPEATEKFREAAELADRHYRLGAVPVSTYVEMQNRYLEALETLLDTEREALEAALKLQELTGLDLNAVENAP